MLVIPSAGGGDSLSSCSTRAIKSHLSLPQGLVQSLKQELPDAY